MKTLILKQSDLPNNQTKSENRKLRDTLSSEWDIIIVDEDLTLQPEMTEYLQTRLIRDADSKIIISKLTTVNL